MLHLLYGRKEGDHILLSLNQRDRETSIDMQLSS